MGSHDQSSETGIKTGNPHEDASEIELAGSLVSFFGLPLVRVQGSGYGHDEFGSKAKEKRCFQEAAAGSNSISICCSRGLETQGKSQQWGKENRAPFVELTSEDGLVDINAVWL